MAGVEFKHEAIIYFRPCPDHAIQAEQKKMKDNKEKTRIDLCQVSPC